MTNFPSCRLVRKSVHPLHYKPRWSSFGIRLATTQTSDWFDQATLHSHWLLLHEPLSSCPLYAGSSDVRWSAFPSQCDERAVVRTTAVCNFATYHDQVRVYFLTQPCDVKRLLSLACSCTVMQEEEPRRRQPSSHAATATVPFHSTPHVFDEHDHPMCPAPCVGHPAGAQRPHPTSPPRARRLACAAREKEVAHTRRQCPLLPASNSLSLEGVPGGVVGAAVDTNRLRHIAPFSLTAITRSTRSFPRQ